MSHPLFKKMCTSSSDQHALSYLSDVELKQDSKDPRPFELVFVCQLSPRGQREGRLTCPSISRRTRTLQI